MSFSIEPKTLKKLVDFYHPNNKGEQMKYMLFLKGQDEMYMNLQTSPFQGISQNSIDERMAWFGKNKVENPFQYTIVDVIIKSFTQYTCMPWLLLFSVILFVVGLFFDYNHLPISYIEGLAGIVAYVINTGLIFIGEYSKFKDLKKIYGYRSENNYCDAWRENRQEQIDAQYVVVGDIIELGVGSVVPADGWMIQGQLKVEQYYSHGTITASKTTMKACVNHLDKRNNTKKYTIANKIKPQSPSVHFSPIIIGGSTVTEGQGRMLVLCVGKYSRVGQFQLLLKNFNPHKRLSQLQQKMEDYTTELFKYAFLGVILLVLGLFVKQLVLNIIAPDQTFWNLLEFHRFQYITLSLNLMLVMIPQGCLLGLSIGLFIHKKKIQLSHQINVKRLVNCESMSYVEYICHDKQSEKSYFRIKQWWNDQGKVQVDEEIQDKSRSKDYIIEDNMKDEQRLFRNIHPVNKTYLKFFRKAMTVTSESRDIKIERSQRSLKYGSFRNLDECFIDYSRRKSYINLNQIDEEEIIQQIPYDNIRKRTMIVTGCPQDLEIQYLNQEHPEVRQKTKKETKSYRISLKVQGSQKLLPNYGSKHRLGRKVIVYVRGKYETVLQMCTYIMSKETGKVAEIDEEKAMEIKTIIDSMLRRQLRAILLAYKVTTMKENFNSDYSWDDENGYVLLAIIGINDTRSTQDFQLLTKIKQLDINMMISTSNSMETGVSAANEIGIIKADQSSILINGAQFLHIVGGIICSNCKKPVCLCEHGNQNHKIKNIDQFERILRHLDVLANAEAFHKYTLIVGLRNKNICSAMTGKKLIDIPSMLSSQVSLYSADKENENSSKDQSLLQKSVFQIQIPNSSVAVLYALIKQSRICHRFIRKYIRLTTCSCIVSTVLMVINLALFKQDFGLKLIHVFWIQFIVMFFLAIAMAFDNQTQDNDNFSIMNEQVSNFSKNKSLIDTDGWKQIATFSLTQVILMVVISFLGPLFLPQKSDLVDEIIGQDWIAKYADSTKSIICSGLPYPLQGANWHYKQTFIKYGIFSRHQTIVFALFSVMQIFNYFNFRQFNLKEVNIFKNLKVLTIFILIGVLLGNIFFVQNGSRYVGLYPKGLIFEQWIICFGIAMSLWVVGILVRLFPNLKKEDNERKVKWQNKAYNLAVKSVIPKNQLSDFEVDEYFQLKPEIFQTRKID